jgi:hypothetical protein
MTFLGAIGRALPFLISRFETALIVASVVVAAELITIAYIKKAVYGHAVPVGRFPGDSGRAYCSGRRYTEQKKLI